MALPYNSLKDVNFRRNVLLRYLQHNYFQLESSARSALPPEQPFGKKEGLLFNESILCYFQTEM